METKDPHLSGVTSEPKEGRTLPPTTSQAKPIPVPLGQIMGNHERITYTYCHNQEVGCVHFDVLRGEIYLNGHNARTMTLTKAQWNILEEFYVKLRHHPQFRSNRYQQALNQFHKEKDPKIEEVTEVIEEEPVRLQQRSQIRTEIIEALTRTITKLDPRRPYQPIEIVKQAYETYTRLVTTPTKARFATFMNYLYERKRPCFLPIKELLDKRGIQIIYREARPRQCQEAFVKAIDTLDLQKEYSWPEIVQKAYGIYSTAIIIGKKLSLNSFKSDIYRRPFLRQLIQEKGIKIREGQ